MSQLQFARKGPPVSAALRFSAICKALAMTMLHVNIQPPAGMSWTWIWKSDHNVKLGNPHKIKHKIRIIWSLQSLILQAVIKSSQYQNFHREEVNILHLHPFVKILLCLQPEAVWLKAGVSAHFGTVCTRIRAQLHTAVQKYNPSTT